MCLDGKLVLGDRMSKVKETFNTAKTIAGMDHFGGVDDRLVKIKHRRWLKYLIIFLVVTQCMTGCSLLIAMHGLIGFIAMIVICIAVGVVLNKLLTKWQNNVS